MNKVVIFQDNVLNSLIHKPGPNGKTSYHKQNRNFWGSLLSVVSRFLNPRTCRWWHQRWDSVWWCWQWRRKADHIQRAHRTGAPANSIN